MIPSINSEKFYSQDPSPQKFSLDIPFDEELVDWEKDDDLLTDEIAEDVHFLEEENINPSDTEYLSDALHLER